MFSQEPPPIGVNIGGFEAHIVVFAEAETRCKSGFNGIPIERVSVGEYSSDEVIGACLIEDAIGCDGDLKGFVR